MWRVLWSFGLFCMMLIGRLSLLIFSSGSKFAKFSSFYGVSLLFRCTSLGLKNNTTVNTNE